MTSDKQINKLRISASWNRTCRSNVVHKVMQALPGKLSKNFGTDELEDNDDKIKPKCSPFDEFVVFDEGF